jgi:hypothetical protein
MHAGESGDGEKRARVAQVARTHLRLDTAKHRGRSEQTPWVRTWPDLRTQRRADCRFLLIAWQAAAPALAERTSTVPENVVVYGYVPLPLPRRLPPSEDLRHLNGRLASPRNSGRRAV